MPRRQQRATQSDDEQLNAGVVVGGAHDHEVSPSGANQEEEPTAGSMDLIPYNPRKDRGPVY